MTDRSTSLRLWVSITLAALFALPTSGRAQDLPTVRDPIETVGYDVEVETASFEVRAVDFDSDLVLFRHVYRLYKDGAPSSVDCGYPALRPGFGEVIGIYDTGADGYRLVWTVAPPVTEAPLCARAGEVQKTRAQANEAIADFGLETSSHEIISPDEAGRFVVSAEGGSVTLKVESGTRPDGTAYSRLVLGDEVIYTRVQAPGEGQSVSVSFLSLVHRDGYVTVLETVTSLPREMKAGAVPRTLYSFSPTIDVLERAGLRVDEPEPPKAPAKKSPPSKMPPPDGPDIEREDNCATDACGCGACLCGAPALVTGIVGLLGCAACGEVCAPVGWLFDEILPDDEDDDDGDEDTEPAPEPGQEPEQFARWMRY